jgi:hypothetical protein
MANATVFSGMTHSDVPCCHTVYRIPEDNDVHIHGHENTISHIEMPNHLNGCIVATFDFELELMT